MRKTWFITGASRGFGAIIVARALEQGDRVVATARKPETVSERFGEHPQLLAVALDVTDEAQARAAAQAAVERFGSIDVLVNNAGYGLLGAVEEATAAEVEAIYRTNVFSLLAVTRAVLPHMRRQRSGRKPGDPANLAAVLVDLVETPDPPVRLPLGSDAVARIEAENAATAALLDRWRSVAVSTDFAAAASAGKK